MVNLDVNSEFSKVERSKSEKSEYDNVPSNEDNGIPTIMSEFQKLNEYGSDDDLVTSESNSSIGDDQHSSSSEQLVERISPALIPETVDISNADLVLQSEQTIKGRTTIVTLC